MPRMIDADKLEAKCKEIIAQEREYGTATVSWAHAYESFLDMLETTPTITADDYFDAVDRIKPCRNCRYTLLGALTEDVHQTNADYIRSMTDEDLAKWLCFRFECYGEEDLCPAHAFCKPGGQNGMLDWLQQPYKENEDDR